MVLFDRFVSRGTGEQKGKPFFSNPYAKLVSELDAVIKKAKEQYQGDSKTIDDFARTLKGLCKSRYGEAAQGQPPMKAEAHFFLSEDRMSAFACLFPPKNGGDEITLEGFMEDLHYEGIRYGILQEEIQKELMGGRFRLFPVARGRLP